MKTKSPFVCFPMARQETKRRQDAAKNEIARNKKRLSRNRKPFSFCVSKRAQTLKKARKSTRGAKTFANARRRLAAKNASVPQIGASEAERTGVVWRLKMRAFRFRVAKTGLCVVVATFEGTPERCSPLAEQMVY